MRAGDIALDHRPSLEHPQYAPADSRELCLGYAPFANLAQEQGEFEDEETNQLEEGAS